MQARFVHAVDVVIDDQFPKQRAWYRVLEGLAELLAVWEQEAVGVDAAVETRPSKCP